jgi:hypothetical protein
MKKLLKTSKKARFAADHGSRPLDMWTRYSVLVAVKRQCPELFCAAKRLSDSELMACISPYVAGFHTWCDGVMAHHRLSPWRLMDTLGLDDEAKAWRIAHHGMDY